MLDAIDRYVSALKSAGDDAPKPGAACAAP